MPNPTIPEFYSECNLLITGGTGFVGLALVEKVLRTLPEVGNLYLLLRPKRGKEIDQRLNELIKDPIFDRLKELHGNDRFSKLVAVAGDVGEDNLGLSEEDRDMLRDKVHIVFHSAATLDFEASLKPTVNINLLGTRRVVELCKTIMHFKGLLHVSSAYVNANLKNADEIIYPAVEDADKVIELATSLSEPALEEVTPVLLGSHPNTYTFTKSLAELEVSKDCSPAFPTCIIRPSMIVGAWKEPVPGWTNSKNGPQGFIMGAAKGVVRRLPVDKNLVYDYIPVDIVVNQMLTGAWHVSVNRPHETPVFQCTTSVYKPFRWIDVETLITSLLHRYPLSKAVWYPTLKLLPSLLLFKISAVIFHLIPAYILDTVTRVTGGRPILVKLHTNVNKSLDRLAPFIFNEWMFDNKKSLGLHQSLTPADQKTFGLDVKELKWEPYFEDLAQGVRKYLNNESPDTLPSARAKDKILFILNLILQALVLSFLWLLIAALMGNTMVSTAWVLPILYIAFNSL